MVHCDLKVRWKVASDLQFQAAISEPETPPFYGISGDLAPSSRKSLATAIVRFWRAKRLRYFSSEILRIGGIEDFELQCSNERSREQLGTM